MYNTTIASKYVLSAFVFLTTWTWLAMIFHRKLYRYIDLLFLGLVVMIIGIYFGHVHPKYYIISLDDTDNNNIILNDEISLLLADILHVIPFMTFLTLYGRYYAKQTHHTLFIRTFCVITMYLILFTPSRVYHVNTIELLMLGVITMILYFLLILVLYNNT